MRSSQWTLVSVLVVVAMLTGACERRAAEPRAPERPSEGQVRRLVEEHVNDWHGERTFAIDEFSVLDWYDVRPGLVRVRVAVRVQSLDGETRAPMRTADGGFRIVSDGSLTAGTEREYDLEHWDSGWRLRAVE